MSTVVDEPVVRGGTNMGPTPTNPLMAFLLGCTNVIAQRIAHKMGVEFHDMTVDVKAQFDRRGASLEEAISVPFPEITQTISARSNATPAQIEESRRDLARFCPISVVIHAAGSKIYEIWNITPG